MYTYELVTCLLGLGYMYLYTMRMYKRLILVQMIYGGGRALPIDFYVLR